MRKMNTMKRRFALILAVCLVLIMALPLTAFADEPTDEILNYEITADVNEDGTVNLTYHIDWKVLVTEGIGPMSWVNVGIPNDRYVSYEPLSDNITSMSYSGGDLEIYLDRDYYEDEVASFDFLVVQDYIYSMNGFEEGSTTYSFTPGWFSGIDVDNLTIKWNSEKATSWNPECLVMDGYNVWKTSLPAGETFTIDITYPNDAYNFDDTKYIEYSDGSYQEEWTFIDYFSFVIVIILFLIFQTPFVFGIAAAIYYAAHRGLKGEKTEKKVTRTKVKYYASCPGCGAVRGEGETQCSYCGHSFIESEEILTEENIKDEDKEAMAYDTDGEYRYTSSPNTFVRVSVVNIPIPRPSGGGGRGLGGGGGHSHHSSCACASHCACACACACAGGGRAGCTTKDFYKTALKLKQLELKK